MEDSLIRPARSILAQAGAKRLKRATDVELSNVVYSEETGVISAMAAGTRTEEGRPLYQLRIDPRGWCCDCWDFTRRAGACKHVTALALRVLSETSDGQMPKLAQSRRAFLSIRNACQDVKAFDQQCMTIASELAEGREVEPWDFVRAARTVALMHGKAI